MDIVRQIIDETKIVIGATLPDFKALPYEWDIDDNNERSLDNAYGFIASTASFTEGRSFQHTTMEHTFQLILTSAFQNKDSDAPLTNKLNNLYDSIHKVLAELQKKPLALPTAGYRVLLISGVNIEAPELNYDNGSVILRANFNYQYRFKNNC